MTNCQLEMMTAVNELNVEKLWHDMWMHGVVYFLNKM